MEISSLHAHIIDSIQTRHMQSVHSSQVSLHFFKHYSFVKDLCLNTRMIYTAYFRVSEILEKLLQCDL